MTDLLAVRKSESKQETAETQRKKDEKMPGKEQKKLPLYSLPLEDCLSCWFHISSKSVQNLEPGLSSILEKAFQKHQNWII